MLTRWFADIYFFSLTVIQTCLKFSRDMRDKRANKARGTSASFKNYRNRGNQLYIYEGWAHAQSLLRSSSRTARWGTITPKNKYDTRSFVDSYLMYVTVSYTRRNLTKSLRPLIVDASYFVDQAKKSTSRQSILLVAVVGEATRLLIMPCKNVKT